MNNDTVIQSSENPSSEGGDSSAATSFNREELIAQLCKEEKVQLFDMEFGGGFLKVFINTEDGTVQHTHCAGLSNRILNHKDVEKILPGATILEVSSPGVNRKLARPDHFKGAVGERVKIAFRDAASNQKQIVFGELKQFENGVLIVETAKEKKKEARVIEIPFTAVTEARVDFLFK